MKALKLPDGFHNKAGRFDVYGRWYPNDRFKLQGTFNVRGPSKTYPFTFLKHFYSTKYAKKFLTKYPMEYMYLQSIDPKSADGIELTKLHFINRIS